MNWVNIKSALVSGLIMAIITVGSIVISSGDIFSLDMKSLANAGVISFLTAIVSFVKSLLTTQNGNFVGVVNIK